MESSKCEPGDRRSVGTSEPGKCTPAGRTIGRAGMELWLPFLDTYRTMCLAPQPDFRRVLEDVLAMQLAV